MRKITKLMAAGLIIATVEAGMPGISAQAAYKPIPKSLRGTWKTKGTATYRRQLHVKSHFIYETFSYKISNQWQGLDLGIAKAHLIKSSKNTYLIKGISTNSGKNGGNFSTTIHVKKNGKHVSVKGIDEIGTVHKYVSFHK
ncbi:hypothetical protein ACFQ44_00275 [Levilactobacillus lanxiensis]|uniref:DUF5626 domain-containing protein n=1 Tax=Levilactobacillus lanxiensis TaxID=2799568 RepID=A0ABW4CZM2_9LACO|nr:hypothetical protein [Levilactobacillus lanxiensis]